MLSVCACLLVTAGYTADDRRTRRQRERIEDLSERLESRLEYAEPTQEQEWLHQQASTVLDRLRKAQDDRYLSDRLARACDALLEASERILNAREQNEQDEKRRDETARSMQNDYFRVQQAEYFAKLSSEENAEEYVRRARSLYQQARRAYDREQYVRAETLGDSAGYVAQAIEALAQAAIRDPDPPRIP